MKQRLTDLEHKFMVAERRMGGGIVRELGMGMYTLLYLKWITDKEAPYSTGESAQCYVAAWVGGEFGENGYMYMYG